MSGNKSAMLDVLNGLNQSLSKEIIQKEPCPERCLDIITSVDNLTTFSEQRDDSKLSCNGNVNKIKIDVSILEKTQMGKLMTKAIKTFRRYRRSSSGDGTQADIWSKCIELSEQLTDSWKASVSSEIKGKIVEESNDGDCLEDDGLPKSASSYRRRLFSQKKEMYKDPPVLPPSPILIESRFCSIPKRNSKTKELLFHAGDKSNIESLLNDFRPNCSPEEILRSGAFGGTYFRPIVSAVTNLKYNSNAVLNDTVEQSWISGLNKSTMLTSSTYKTNVNKYGVKCGGSLGMWESSGW
eukprot:CAMPEP_0184865990 /NCGR_PEP_ID=MMETSP0580-20130426/20188_1 /TAXON_ID=1118495 /ORGANISM="Dactyliosolen fragilissimus" /LENGTH=295 /DNA_ID=CAMNT_0027365419 /DNA_START=31 /DNA_END=915 /DNA_ORIENTATION=+